MASAPPLFVSSRICLWNQKMNWSLTWHNSKRLLYNLTLNTTGAAWKKTSFVIIYQPFWQTQIVSVLFRHNPLCFLGEEIQICNKNHIWLGLLQISSISRLKAMNFCVLLINSRNLATGRHEERPFASWKNKCCNWKKQKVSGLSFESASINCE